MQSRRSNIALTLLQRNHSVTLLAMCIPNLVKRDIQDSDEEAVRVKEQSILELGGLLAKTGQAAGKITSVGARPSLLLMHPC